MIVCGPAERYEVPMKDTMPADAIEPEFENETAMERESRIQREAALIAKAHAEMDAGLWLDEAELDAWLQAAAKDQNAPMPAPKTGPA